VSTARTQAAEHAIVVRDLSVRRDGRLVIDNVSFEAMRGELLCLCGPNGGGKTTLLKALLGLLRPETGTITVLGETPEKARPRVGYLPQRKAFANAFPATAVDLIVARLRGTWPLRISTAERERARAVLGRVGGERLLDQPLAGLSGGEIQRVFLARALVNAPALLLLDEPTAGVDAQGRADLLELLEVEAAGDATAVVLVTHNLSAVRRLADRVLCLDARIVAAGAPEDVLGDAGLTSLGLVRHDHIERDSAVCEEE
jgi:ABC-type Mn2+/Zn2+ transport system ATPase subunit